MQTIFASFLLEFGIWFWANEQNSSRLAFVLISIILKALLDWPPEVLAAKLLRNTLLGQTTFARN